MKPGTTPDWSLPADASALSGPAIGDTEFDFIRHVVRENAGISLGPHKRQLVQGRLMRRLRALGLRSFDAYCDHLSSAGPEELVALINAITTNVTAFFRENHHFEALEKYMLPEAMQRSAATRRIRIWSAGCSSGEEPYSIAISALRVMPTSPRWDLKILATDIDSDVLNFALRGTFPYERVENLPHEYLQRFFLKGHGERSGFVQVRREVSELITFRTLNLISPWPMTGLFDVIFCRNVMIYFDHATRERLLARFADILVPGGYLCLGHSESLYHQKTIFRLVGKTIYRKPESLADADR